MYIYLPTTNTARDARWRRVTCNGCGFTVEGHTSRHLTNKVWNEKHLPYHFEVAAYERMTLDPTMESL